MQGRTGGRSIGECSTTELPRPLQLHHIHIGKKSGGKPTTTKLRAFSASRYRTLKGIHFNVILGTPLPIDLCKQLKMHDLITGFKYLSMHVLKWLKGFHYQYQITLRS